MSRLLIEKNDSVWLLRFHNPPHSFMDHFTARELNDFLDEVEVSSEVRVVVMTGSAPDVFIRHYDVSELLEKGKAIAAKGRTFSIERPVPENPIHRALARMERLPVPFIAAINGSAMGGGFEMALACDLRLVQAGDYALGLPEVNIGLLAGAGGTQRLPRLIGQSRALAMELCGRTISPRQAVDYGLAMECVDGDVLGRALEIAGQLAAKSSRALAHIKQLIRNPDGCNIEEGLARERTLFCDLMSNPDSHQEMAAMVAGDKDIRDSGE